MTEESRELRDRIIRLETNHENLRDSHNVTKTEFAAFKKEMLAKFDELGKDINGIKLVMAKYLGIAIGVIAVTDLLIKLLIK